MILDDAGALRSIDRSNMLATMEETPERLSIPPDATSTFPKKLEIPRNVVFGGVGGSGIAGDILTDYSRDMVQVPVSICRSIRLPNFVGKDTLFVAISYSGDTQETLGLLNQAKQRGATLAVITSGGKLLAQAKDESLPYLKVPASMLPRVALPELLAAATYVAGMAGIVEGHTALLSSGTQALKKRLLEIKPTIPTQQNPAKRMAHALLGKVPLLIGNEENGSVLRRFKNELNENSKMPAFYYTVPEAYHDDIEGLKSLQQLCNTQPILLRNPDEGEGQKRTRERLAALLHELKFPEIVEFEGTGGDKFSQILTAILFGDYVSVYLAALRQVDPSQLALIPKFRAAMQGT
jgi:glucose/mannose-6-phosphate isomerase